MSPDGFGATLGRYGSIALVSGLVGSLGEWAGVPFAVLTLAVVLSAMLLGAALFTPTRH
jgi:hypothetical protein